MLKTVFSVMWMLFLFISSSNINSQFIDRASNRVYTQEMQIPLQEMTCSDGTAPDVTTGLCADGSQPQGQVAQQLVCSDGSVMLLPVFVLMVHSPSRKDSSRKRKRCCWWYSRTTIGL